MKLALLDIPKTGLFATRPNFVLQVIPGSNKLGRITHNPVGNLQTGADPDRLKEVMKVLPVIDVDLEPGITRHTHQPK